jgi:hypothetical protein
VKSCVAYLAGALLFGAAVGAALFLWLDPPLAAIGGAVAGGIGFLTGGGVTAARDAARRKALVRKASRGVRPKDGQLAVALGRIEPLGPPLTAPFTGTECVAYEYDVYREGSEGRNKDFTGLALTPSVIRTPSGDVHLLGFAPLEDFPEAKPREPGAYERARAYLASAPLEEIGLLRVLSLAKELFTDDDGAIRKDFRLQGDATVEGRLLAEKTVSAGAQVCAFGLYSKARGGLVPGLSKGIALELFPGDATAALRRVQSKASGSAFAAGCAFTALFGFALLALGFAQRERNAEKGGARIRDFFNAVSRGDRAAIEAGLAAGIAPNVTDSFGETPLARARDAATARLLVE